MHKRSGVVPIVLLLALGGSGLCAAQQPDAGSVLRDIQIPALTVPVDGSRAVLVLPDDSPRETLPEGIKLQVAGFSVSGNTVLSSAFLTDLIAGYTGRELSLAELYDAADVLTDSYVEQGYLLSRAYLPAQEIDPDSGMVELVVLEGRYGGIELENTSLVKDPGITRMLRSLETGTLVKVVPLEKQLLLLDDLPGIRVQTRLSAGALPGQTALTVVAEPENRISGGVGLDNQGSRSTGTNRLNAAINIASPFGIGDAFNASVLYTSEDQLYYSARYDVPLGARGTGAVVNVSAMDYELGGEFKNLQASGSADTISLGLRQALKRSRKINLRTDLSYDQRDLEDLLSQGASRTYKEGRDVALSLSGDARDLFNTSNITAFTLRWVAGDISLVSGAFAPDAPQGRFNKLQYSVLHLVNLPHNLTLYGALQGQVSGDNLDSSQKFMLGGSTAVRGYPLGEASADEGAVLNVELRYALSQRMQVKALLDAGYAKLLDTPTTTDDNHRRLSAAGVGVDLRLDPGLLVSVTASARTGEHALSDKDESWRVWGSLQWSF